MCPSLLFCEGPTNSSALQLIVLLLGGRPDISDSTRSATMHDRER